MFFLTALCLVACASLLFVHRTLRADPPVPGVGYTDTPMIFPGSKWHVHDGNRPQPSKVDPGPAPKVPMPVPSDAKVLFNGKDFAAWSHQKWLIKDGYMQVAGGGDLQTKDEFGDCQLHIEFCTPEQVVGNSQGRGNSGVFFMGRYEIQVLDSYNNPTYPDGQCAALYAQTPPLVNACRKPGEWQTYDITFRTPRFEDGKLIKPGYVTVIQNGIVVQNNTELLGLTNHRTASIYVPHGPKGPIRLQDHGNPMRFRNIWVRPLTDPE
jgi:Domain of Unknown Function (DUF1080)